MATDMQIWRTRVIDEMRSIADERFQRLVWFGGGDGKWVDSPTEQICKFDDLSVPRVLANPANGLSEREKQHLTQLSNMMDSLVENTPNNIKPQDLIDDSRWIEIRNQAARTMKVLCGEG